MPNSFSQRPSGTLTSLTEFVKVMSEIMCPKASRNQSHFLRTGAKISPKLTSRFCSFLYSI
jgi:hypothetical protein